MKPFKEIWIEAECWVVGDWKPLDVATDVILDVAIELIFENFGEVQELPQAIINEMIFVIARNHEQGNILAWKMPNSKISYLNMNEVQFRFLAEEIGKRGEANAKFQVAFVYRKLNNITKKDIELLRKLSTGKDEYVRQQSLITLEILENKIA